MGRNSGGTRLGRVGGVPNPTKPTGAYQQSKDKFNQMFSDYEKKYGKHGK